MDRIIPFLFFFLTINAFGQKKEIKNFNFSGIDISYSKMDYSRYGLAQVFITLFEDTSKTSLIEKNAIKCLSKKDDIYHTYYYFLKIPAGFTLEEKEALLSEFIGEINKSIENKEIAYYLNLDTNFAAKFLNENPHLIENRRIRVCIDADDKNICKGLYTR